MIERLDRIGKNIPAVRVWAIVLMVMIQAPLALFYFLAICFFLGTADEHDLVWFQFYKYLFLGFVCFSPLLTATGMAIRQRKKLVGASRGAQIGRP